MGLGGERVGVGSLCRRSIAPNAWWQREAESREVRKQMMRGADGGTAQGEGRDSDRTGQGGTDWQRMKDAEAESEIAPAMRTKESVKISKKY